MASMDNIAILTSENVRLNYTLAGLGSRLIAFLVDFIILILFSIALTFVFAMFGLKETDITNLELEVSLKAGLYIAAMMLLHWSYFFFFEWINWGQTPGKQMTGLRVSMADGAPADMAACAVRNLIRIIDFLFTFVGVTIFVLIFTPRYQRLGDLAAG